MRGLALGVVVALAACGAPKIAPEPEPEESPFELSCGLAVDMKPDVVERKCGAPFSKMYAPEYPDAVVWRYCGKKADGSYRECHQMFGVVFYNGTTLRWGRVYEVVQ